MVRVKIYFQGLKNYLFKSDFDDHLSYLFHDKISSIFEGSEFENFQFYSFSDFVVENSTGSNDGLISQDGVVSIIVSSVNDKFLKVLLSYFVMGESILFEDNKLTLFKLEFLPKPNFSRGFASFVTISPIFLSNCIVKGNLGNILKEILMKNYCKYYKLDKCPYYCEFFSKKQLFGSYVTYDKSDIYYDYYYNMDIIMKGDSELIDFAYEVGLGNNNNQGFGMLDLF